MRSTAGAAVSVADRGDAARLVRTLTEWLEAVAADHQRPPTQTLGQPRTTRHRRWSSPSTSSLPAGPRRDEPGSEEPRQCGAPQPRVHPPREVVEGEDRDPMACRPPGCRQPCGDLLGTAGDGQRRVQHQDDATAGQVGVTEPGDAPSGRVARSGHGRRACTRSSRTPRRTPGNGRRALEHRRDGSQHPRTARPRVGDDRGPDVDVAGLCEHVLDQRGVQVHRCPLTSGASAVR